MLCGFSQLRALNVVWELVMQYDLLDMEAGEKTGFLVPCRMAQYIDEWSLRRLITASILVNLK
jgi:hypothetical protein